MKTRFLEHGQPALAAALAAVVALLASWQAPAYAVPPANDDLTGFEVVDVPTTLTVDTSQATAAPDDGDCVHGRSVWYRVRPGTAGRVRVSTLGSDYDTVLALFEGRRNDRTLLRCNDDRLGLDSAVGARLEADRSYWIAISSCCSDRARHGGQAVLRLFRHDGPPSTTVAVDSVESGGTSGRLLVAGTITCTSPSLVETYLAASQRVGTGVARGDGFTFTEVCTEQPTAWRSRVDSDTGWAFQPGTVRLDLESWVSNGFGFATVEQELTEEAVDNPLGVQPR